MEKEAVILVTGSGGMVGANLVKLLQAEGFRNLLTPRSNELDLKNKEQVEQYFSENKIDYVIHLAARVGGIVANIESPAEFLYENLMITAHVVEAAKKFKVKKLLNLGSSCIYPKNCAQPMNEDLLLSGKLEPTNEGYALAKIVGLKICQYYNKQYGTNFISLMPCNLYGPYDHFEFKRSHVMSALLLKFHDAKQKGSPFVEVWGSGNARREFLFVEDLANAILYFMNTYDAKELETFINIGLGEDISIKDLAYSIKDVVGFEGDIRFDTSKPEGMMKKVLDVRVAEKLGWKHITQIKDGIEKTYRWFLENET